MSYPSEMADATGTRILSTKPKYPTNSLIILSLDFNPHVKAQTSQYITTTWCTDMSEINILVTFMSQYISWSTTDGILGQSGFQITINICFFS